MAVERLLAVGFGKGIEHLFGTGVDHGGAALPPGWTVGSHCTLYAADCCELPDSTVGMAVVDEHFERVETIYQEVVASRATVGEDQ